jgi:ubiquinone/menaquinone biosynthesis C-methylase UbiE
VREYYEELWQALPQELKPPDWEVRRHFLCEELRPGDRVLDLGCGQGAFIGAARAAGAEAVGADVAEAALQRARRRHPDVPFVLVPWNGPLPFDDGAFDLVWASEVIEHVGDTGRWLSEVRRVLLPAGRLLVTTPSHGRGRVLLGGMERFSEPLGDHLHLYTKRSLQGLLVEFGFGEVVVRAAGGPPGLRRLLLGRAVR